MKKFILTLSLIFASLSTMSYAQEQEMSEMQKLVKEHGRKVVIGWKVDLFNLAQKRLKETSQKQIENDQALQIDPSNKELLKKRNDLVSEFLARLTKRTKHFNDLKEIAPFHPIVTPRTKTAEEIAMDREIDIELGLIPANQVNDQRQPQEVTPELELNGHVPMMGGPNGAHAF